MPDLLSSERLPMTFSLFTHDAWGRVQVGAFQSLEEARQAFVAIAQDPWYRSDGTVKGLELVQHKQAESDTRLDWHSFQS